jgi:hypothetical protein
MDGVVERNPDSYGNEVAADKSPTREELERQPAERLEEIHQYLRDLYARREVVARTETASGLQLDWIPVESQAPDGAIADPPGEDRPTVFDGGELQPQPARFELQAEGAELGPPGTVPVVRKPIERIRPTGELQDWLAKGLKPNQVTPPDDPRGVRPPGGGYAHEYAHAAQTVTCFGTEGAINTWRPYVEWSNEFSLGQLWLVRGFGFQLQTLEVGVQNLRDLYGDWEPHLFTFYTTNGYTQSGDFIGGYNTDVKGWVQVATTVAPGSLITPLSQFGGTQLDLTIKVQLSAGNWWVQVGGTWMGYYPASLYSPTGLRSEASSVDWGGEIVDSPEHSETTQTDMGSGRWPYEGWQFAAYMRNLLYQSDPGGTMTQMQGIPTASRPGCYNIAADFAHTGPWGSHFWWGGPGRNPACP